MANEMVFTITLFPWPILLLTCLSTISIVQRRPSPSSQCTASSLTWQQFAQNRKIIRFVLSLAPQIEWTLIWWVESFNMAGHVRWRCSGTELWQTGYNLVKRC
jgi:hypothetical protein